MTTIRGYTLCYILHDVVFHRRIQNDWSRCDHGPFDRRTGSERPENRPDPDNGPSSGDHFRLEPPRAFGRVESNGQTTQTRFQVDRSIYVGPANHGKCFQSKRFFIIFEPTTYYTSRVSNQRPMGWIPLTEVFQLVRDNLIKLEISLGINI